MSLIDNETMWMMYRVNQQFSHIDQVEAESAPEVSMKYSIEAVPTCILLRVGSISLCSKKHNVFFSTIHNTELGKHLHLFNIMYTN